MDRPCRRPVTLPLVVLSACVGAAAPAPATAAAAAAARQAVVIAHRGASGYLPEHTLPAYALAYGMGADYLEPDLVMTRDRILIALHDIHLEATTDVEERFPDRRRDDGRWYAADFRLDEIKQLAVHERTERDGRPAFAGRFTAHSRGFEVPTFVEVIELVRELNRLTGCDVGLYPETKDPAFHANEGLPLEEELLRLLDEYGYAGSEAKVMIQSFDPRNLKRIRRELGSALPLVQLISASAEQDALVSDAALDDIASYAVGIGPSKRRIEDGAGRSVDGNRLVVAAHARGLVVHPYTFRADDVPDFHADFDSELRRFLDRYGVDGLFTDHPDRAVAVIGRGRPRSCAGADE